MKKLKVKLLCDRCGNMFLYNVLFDKNGVSINPITRLCSNCFVEVKNDNKKD